MEEEDKYEIDTPVTIAQYMLSPDIPEEERQAFVKFYVMFSKTMALGNIERHEIMEYKIALKEILILLDIGLYQVAREIEAEALATMTMTRSVGGFYTLYGQHGVQRSESLQKVIGRETAPKRGFLSRLMRKKEPEYEETSNIKEAY